MKSPTFFIRQWSSDAIITITEIILASLFSRHFHLFTSFFQQRGHKMLIALKSWDTVQQLHFIFFNYFNASVLQCALDAPIPTPNQSSRLTLPKQGATLRLLKIDRQIVKNNMEKLSPCHAEVCENCSKNSIETQWMKKIHKKHNKLIFHQEKRFREFCQQASSWNTYFDPSKL